jgi:hypothetical protein
MMIGWSGGEAAKFDLKFFVGLEHAADETGFAKEDLSTSNILRHLRKAEVGRLGVDCRSRK